MRQRIFLILFFVAASSAFTCLSAQEAIFEKYEDTNGVTTIYISKTMLGMIPNVKAGKHDIGKIAPKLDYLRILTCEKAALITSLVEDAKKAYRSGGYEVIMKMNDGDEKVTIYQRSMKDGKNDFSLLSEEKDEATIINVKGSITLKDIKDLTGQH